MKPDRKILLPEAPPALDRLPTGAPGLKKRVAKIPEDLNCVKPPLNTQPADVDSHLQTRNLRKGPPPLPAPKAVDACPSPTQSGKPADDYPWLFLGVLVLFLIVSGMIIAQIAKPSPTNRVETTSVALRNSAPSASTTSSAPQNPSSSTSTYRPNPYVVTPPPASLPVQSSSSRSAASSNLKPPVVKGGDPSPANPNSYWGSYAPKTPSVKYLKVIGVRRGDTLSMRDRPDPNSRQVGEIPYNATKVESVDDLKNVAYYGKTPWYKVEWLGRVGWVNGTHLQFADRTNDSKAKNEDGHSVAASSQPTGTTEAIVMYVKVIQVTPGDSLTMRSAPNPNSSSVGSIPHDATGVGLLTPIAAGVPYGGVKWFKVEWRGRVGWVNGTHIDR